MRDADVMWEVGMKHNCEAAHLQMVICLIKHMLVTGVRTGWRSSVTI